MPMPSMWTGLSSLLIHALAPQPTATLLAPCVALTTPSRACSLYARRVCGAPCLTSWPRPWPTTRVASESAQPGCFRWPRRTAGVGRASGDPDPARPTHRWLRHQPTELGDGGQVHLNSAWVCWRRRLAAAQLLSRCQYRWPGLRRAQQPDVWILTKPG